MGFLDWVFNKKRSGGESEVQAQRLRDEARQAVLEPHSGATAFTSKDVGAAYGVQAIDDRALYLIQSAIEARQAGNLDVAVSPVQGSAGCRY